MIKPTEDTELRNMVEREIRCGATFKQLYPQSGYYERADSIIKQIEKAGYQKDSVSFPIAIKHRQLLPFAKAMDEVLCKNDYKGGKKMKKTSYDKFVTIMLVIIGIIPYIGMTFLTVFLWDKYIGLPETATFTWHNFLYPPSYLMVSCILGSHVIWWLFCKILGGIAIRGY